MASDSTGGRRPRRARPCPVLLGVVSALLLAAFAPASAAALASPAPARAVRVQWLSPRVGPPSGGELVIIHGAHLDGAEGVTFGGVPAESFHVVEASAGHPHLIEAVAPPGEGKEVVAVITPAGTVSARDPFVYQPMPRINRLRPDDGAPAGGATVRLAGHALQGATAVLFGGVPATSFTVNSPLSITAVAPPGAGAVTVTVITPRGSSSASPAATFSYGPVIESVMRRGGSARGGSTVLISGAGLLGALGVDFGAQPAAAFTVESDDSISAVSPPGSGTVTVSVTTALGTSLPTKDDRFSYFG